MVDDNNFTVTNITIPGKHMLDSGIVSREVYQLGSVIFMRTVGEGTGNYGGLNSNLINVDTVWGGVNRNIIDYIHGLPQ